MISVLMITTNLPNPTYDLLDYAMMSIEHFSNELITEKVLAIDMFPDKGQDKEFFSWYESRGWKLVFGEGGSHRGLADNQLRGLEAVTNEWVLSCEDDTIVKKIPTPSQLQFLIDNDFGVVTYNAGLIYDADEAKTVKHIENVHNYLSCGDDCFLVKDPLIRNKWFINFPAILIRKNDFEELHALSKRFRGESFEASMTRAWDICSFRDKKVGVYLDGHVLFNGPLTQESLHKHAHLRYWNNDESLRHDTLENKRHIWV